MQTYEADSGGALSAGCSEGSPQLELTSRWEKSKDRSGSPGNASRSEMVILRWRRACHSHHLLVWPYEISPECEGGRYETEGKEKRK